MRTFLYVFEAAFLMQVSEMKVRRMVDSGVLDLVGESRDRAGRRRIRLDPDSVQRALATGGAHELRALGLQAILEGRLRVPRPQSRWGMPVALATIPHALDPRSQLVWLAGCNKSSNEERAIAESIREDTTFESSTVALSNKDAEFNQRDPTEHVARV